MKFPMQVQHRTDPYSSVVVANQEQYDALPDEYKPEVTGVAGEVNAQVKRGPGRPAADKSEG